VPYSLERIRQLGARSWKPLVSLAGGALAALNALKATGVPLRDLPGIGPTPAIKWTLVGACVFVLVVIRFPRIAFGITRLILGPPPPPPPGGLIFRGPLPYTSEDKLPGRQKDIDACWLRLQQERFFILEGESGCGKSSFLNALLLPRAREKFKVVECRIADDPFGKLQAALLKEHYRPSDRTATPATVIEAITAGSRADSDDGSPTNEPAKPLLLCIDQFEELFATVKDETRNQLMYVFKHAIASWQLRLLVGIRSDFFDLLMRVCHSVDTERETLDLGNYYTLHAFRRDQADAVLDQMLAPLRANDPLLEQQFEDFSRALIRELLRPPRDKRLCNDDEKTVLPVELQTVGIMLESAGSRNLSVAGLKRVGGKLGLLRAYIEEAKTYVWRKTGVSGEIALLILRQLISQAQTNWAQTPQSIEVGLGLPAIQVERVLDAFAEKYLVNRLPLTSGVSGAQETDAEPSRQYELMHEHLVQILQEAPDPILQRARDAEERLRFWSERTKSTGQFLTASDQPVLTKINSLIAQPIPLIESRRLWQFARNADERRMLARNLRGFSIRLVLALLSVLLPLSAWELWTRTNQYQIRTIISKAPIAQAVYDATMRDDENRKQQLEAVTEWGRVLGYLDKPNVALNAALEVRDQSIRTKVLRAVCEGLARAGTAGELSSLATGLDDHDRNMVLTGTGVGLAELGKYEEALSTAHKINGEEAKENELLSVLDELLLKKKLEIAVGVAYEIKSSLMRPRALASVCRQLIEEGRLDQALSLIDDIVDYIDKDKLLADTSAALVKAGRIDDAMATALKVKYDPGRLNTLVALTEGLLKAGRTADLNQLLKEATARAEGFEYPLGRDQSLSVVAVALVRANRFDQALGLIRKIGDPGIRNSSLSDVANALVHVNRFDQALVITHEVKNTETRSGMLASLFAEFVLIDKADEALRYAQTTSVVSDQVGALSGICDGLVRMHRADEAFKIADRISDDKVVRDNRYERVSRELADAGMPDEALRAIHKMDDEYNRVRALANISVVLARTGRFQEYLTAIRKYGIKDSVYSVLDDLLREGIVDEALDVAREVEGDPRSRALSRVAESLAKTGRVDESSQVLHEALDSAYRIKDHYARASALAAVGEGFAGNGQRAEAEKALADALADIDEIVGDEIRAIGFAKVAKVLARLQSFRSARLVADRCYLSLERLEAYTTILREYAKQQTPSLRAQLEADEKEENAKPKGRVESW
jgi:tetratricopeptide (TPR) repeat protein